MTPTWTPLLGKHSYYEESQIRDLAEEYIVIPHGRQTRLGMLKVIYERVMRPDYCRVQAIKPSAWQIGYIMVFRVYLIWEQIKKEKCISNFGTEEVDTNYACFILRCQSCHLYLFICLSRLKNKVILIVIFSLNYKEKAIEPQLLINVG